jgi:hypothetical protein
MRNGSVVDPSGTRFLFPVRTGESAESGFDTGVGIVFVQNWFAELEARLGGGG